MAQLCARTAVVLASVAQVAESAKASLPTRFGNWKLETGNRKLETRNWSEDRESALGFEFRVPNFDSESIIYLMLGPIISSFQASTGMGALFGTERISRRP
jgi:hypothetical protein